MVMWTDQDRSLLHDKTGNLQSFLLNQGRYIPSDSYKFESGAGIEDHLCFLCRNDHYYRCPSKHYFYSRISDATDQKKNKKKNSIELRTCSDCEYAIDLYDATEAIRYNSLQLNLFSKKKIEDIINDGIYPENISTYSKGNNSHTCGICENEVNQNATEMLVPVGSSTLAYEWYKLCKTCEHGFGESIQDYKYYDKCCNNRCNETYSITQEELKARKKLKTYGKYVCPLCFFDAMPNQEHRYKKFKCSKCKELVFIDLMYENNFKSIDTNKNHVCSNCLTYRNPYQCLISETNLRIIPKLKDIREDEIIWKKYKSYFFIALYPSKRNDINYNYVIIKEVEKGYKIISYCPESYIPEDAIIAAREQCQNILNINYSHYVK